MTRSRLIRWTFYLLLAAVTVACMEVLIAWTLHHPSLIQHLPHRLAHRMENLYAHDVRRIIQFDPDFSRYDPEVTYTLHPNATLQFANVEFETEIRTNHLGLRDDERSLAAPEVIVLGDSITMGWGVQQEETFAELLEARLGRPVLNAGMPSYGTVRELRFLDRLDRSRLTCLLVQYAGNDVGENLAFATAGNRLAVLPEADYRRESDRHLRRIRYVPGKYFYDVFIDPLVPRWRFGTRDRPRLPKTSTTPAKDFLNAFLHATVADLSQVQLIVFQVKGRNEGQSMFADRLRQHLAEGSYPGWLRRMIILPVDAALTRTHYFDLDDHPNRAGHERIADLVLPHVKACLSETVSAHP